MELKVLVTQSRPNLCEPMDCCPPGSSVHGILQARILEWVAIAFSRGSFPPSPHHRQILYCLSHQGMYNGEPIGLVCWAPLYPLVHMREAAPCPVTEGQPCTPLCPALASHSQAIAGAGTDVEQSEPAGPTLITGGDIWPCGHLVTTQMLPWELGRKS